MSNSSRSDISLLPVNILLLAVCAESEHGPGNEVAVLPSSPVLTLFNFIAHVLVQRSLRCMQGIYTLQICKPSTVSSSLRQGKGSQHDLSVVTIQPAAK